MRVPIALHIGWHYVLSFKSFLIWQLKIVSHDFNLPFLITGEMNTFPSFELTLFPLLSLFSPVFQNFIVFHINFCSSLPTGICFYQIFRICFCRLTFFFFFGLLSIFYINRIKMVDQKRSVMVYHLSLCIFMKAHLLSLIILDRALLSIYLTMITFLTIFFNGLSLEVKNAQDKDLNFFNPNCNNKSLLYVLIATFSTFDFQCLSLCL